MNSEAIDYFFAEFDSLLENGKDPKEALLKTAEDYAYVFFSDEQNNKHIKEKQNINEQKIEKIARFLCKYHGFDPDKITKIDPPGIDCKPKYFKSYYKWVDYEDLAKRILEELNK